MTDCWIVRLTAGLCALVCAVLSVAVHVTGYVTSVLPAFVAVNVYGFCVLTWFPLMYHA